MVKVLGKIAAVFETIVIIVLSVCLVLAIYNKFILKSELITIGPYYIFEIGSGSMEYNIHVGDTIIVKKSDTYEVGDVITYKIDGGYVTHRISKIENNTITTKGDANDIEDEPIKKEDIVGKLVYKARLISFAKKYKILTLAILGVFLYLCYLLKDLSNKKVEE